MGRGCGVIREARSQNLYLEDGLPWYLLWVWVWGVIFKEWVKSQLLILVLNKGVMCEYKWGI